MGKALVPHKSVTVLGLVVVVVAGALLLFSDKMNVIDAMTLMGMGLGVQGMGIRRALKPNGGK